MRILPLLLVAGLAVPVHAASLLTLTNPVANGAINTAGGNNDRTDWNVTTAFPTDPDEGNAVDYSALTVAHDDNNFYLRQQLYRTDGGGFLSISQRVFFDTDQNRGSGYQGPSSNFAVGAEYMLEGATLYQYSGAAPTGWGWTSLGLLAYDDFPTNDHEFTIGRSTLGSPVSFDLIAINDFFGAGDAYPDTAHGGGGGGYYTYTTIPEPSALVLVVLGLLAMWRKRA